jgi:energy-converting hydrogenase Eha subunit A
VWSSLVIVVVVIIIIVVVAVVFVIIIIIIIIHHELGRHRPVPASSNNSLFKSLPTRLLPFGP